MKYGLTFSTKYCKELGLDPVVTFKKALNDFNFKSIRIPVYWDLVEPSQNDFDLKELIFFLNSSKFKNLEVTLSVGRKVPRWPEYHEPEWAKDMNGDDLTQSYFHFLNQIIPIINKSADFDFIQVENEPLYDFGISKYKITRDVLAREVSIVKSLTDKPIIITETGENRDWVEAASFADKVGINLYTVVYDSGRNKYYYHNKKPDFYSKKKSKINKDVFIAELQAEAWGPNLNDNLVVDEISKSMSPDHLRRNVELAKQSGFEEAWMWGVEWWYFIEPVMPEILETAKSIIN